MNKLNIETEISNYFKLINEAYKNIKLYKTISSTLENSKITNIKDFIHTVLNSLKFSFIVQTEKIIDKSEAKNICKFIEYCKQNTDTFQEKKESIIKKLTDFDNELTQYETVFQNMKGQRDKIYAHTDKETFYNKNQLYEEYNVRLQDVENIINMLYKNLNNISIAYNGRYYSHYSDPGDDYAYILEKL